MMLKTLKSKQPPRPVFGGAGARRSNNEVRDVNKPDATGSYAGAAWLDPECQLPRR